MPRPVVRAGDNRQRARVLLSATDSTWGGIGAQVTELAVGLADSEFEPVILTTPRGGGELAERSRALGITTHVLPHRLMHRTFPFADYYSVGSFLLRKLLRRERIALLHTHDAKSGLALMRAAASERTPLPLVWHIHDFDSQWVKARTLPVQNREGSMVVAISDAVARWAAARGVESTHIRRIYNGIHLPPFAPDARLRARAALGIADDEIAVALAGRLHPRKGQEDLIRAVAEPVLRDMSLRVFLLGQPERADHEEHLRALASTLGIVDRIVFAGYREDTPELLAGFDISALPARREAFGRVVIESMHAGTPVVVYDEGGLPELVRHGREGLVVRSNDIPGLAAALARLARDTELRARLALAARERARAFTHERWMGEILSLYRELLSIQRARQSV